MAFFEPDFLQFFMDLAPNNNKDWMDENRSRYENVVREPFKKFVDHMITVLAKDNPKLKDLDNKDCIFRINRDIRFAKDKQPYKLNVSALVCVGGKKKHGEGVYFELSPEHLRVYNGIFQPDKDELYDLRNGISNNLVEFKKLYTSKDFKNTYGEIRGDQNKIIPKEFKESGEKEPLIYNKQFYFFKEFDPETILDDNLDTIIADTYSASRPMEKFFSQFVKR
jgi:uncharacterized protein (TIGR02453 family)